MLVDKVNGEIVDLGVLFHQTIQLEFVQDDSLQWKSVEDGKSAVNTDLKLNCVDVL